MKTTAIPKRIQAIKDDITKLPVDAIVNAANNQLRAGAGVCGAIHKAAGPELEKECLTLSGCDTGQAKITKGYRLPAKYVIHTVGPVWHGGERNEPDLLASCYETSLKLALENKIKTIAFPAISCGIFGYPIPQATEIAVQETAKFLECHPEIETVYFVCFDNTIFDAYNKVLGATNHE